MQKLSSHDILRLENASLARSLGAPNTAFQVNTPGCTNICSLTPGSITRFVC